MSGERPLQDAPSLALDIVPGDLSDRRIVDLMRAHLAAARGESPSRSATIHWLHENSFQRPW